MTRRTHAIRSKRRSIRSWVGIYRAQAHVTTVRDLTSLAKVVAAGNYNVIGASHSYNGIQLVDGDTAIHLGKSHLKGITYHEATSEVDVGPSVSILELKKYLLARGRCLANSGNHMTQTVIGALATGTHGYGRNPVMAESVTELAFLDGSGLEHVLRRGDPEFPYVAVSFGVVAPIIRLRLSTCPLGQFLVSNRVCRLSQKTAHAAGAEGVAYVVFPFSSEADPVIALTTLRPTDGSLKPTRPPHPCSPFVPLGRHLLRGYAVLDKWRWLRWYRPLVQRMIAKHAVGLCEEVVTDPRDLDYLYDPYPLLASSRAPMVLRQMFDPTYTGFETAFFVPAAEADAVVTLLVDLAHQLKRESGVVLKSVIGVRELATKSELVFAGNFLGPVAAIDVYCDLYDYPWLGEIQQRICRAYPQTRPHWGKSFITAAFRRSIGDEHIDRLRAIHGKYYPRGTLRLAYETELFLGI